MQNTLIKAVRNLESYRGEAALVTWVTEICRHELADWQRKSRRRPAHDSLDASDSAALATLSLHAPAPREPPAELDGMLLRAAVLDTFAALPKQYALALEAKYGDGLPVDEIARVLDITPIAAQSLLARAREAFRTRWNQRTGSAGLRGEQS